MHNGDQRLRGGIPLRLPLSEKGLTQTEVARLLHITKSAVSRYLSVERGYALDLKPYPDIDAQLEQLAKEMVLKRPDEYQMHYHLVRISIEVLSRGYACKLHATIDPGLGPRRCRACTELFRPTQPESAKGPS